MIKHTLFELQSKLREYSIGDFFKIKGQQYLWELYHIDKEHFFVRNSVTKQLLLFPKK